MNDSTQIQLEQPKGKGKLVLWLVILAVLLIGLLIWKSRSGGKAPETAAMPDTTTEAAPAAPPASASPETTVAEAPAKPIANPSAPAAAKPQTTMAATPEESKPVKAKPEPVAAAPAPKPVQPVEAPKPVASKPVTPETPAPVAPAPEPEPKVVVPPPQPVAATPKPVEAKPVAPAAPTPAPAPVPVAPSSPAKNFTMEDQPMPENTSLSDESKLAMNSLPKAAEAPGEAAAASPVASDAFKKGMDAYQKQDYANASQLLAQLPKPSTKQRGNPVRDQYVEGNFILGLSLLHSDRASDALKAFLTVTEYEKYYPLANMNLGICYVELKQYFKANKAFEAVIRDQGYIDPSLYDDVMQRTKYFWALAWTRMYKTSSDADKQAYYQQQAVMRWKDYQTWFGKNAKYRAENRRADDYLKSLSAM